mmetsp:Transcript_41265/g.96923  ORF Transcript_41265/g.96923 Transcript_41265/m.96923 type:complete len:493 (-) Transcript_41265:54-1532(-)
MMMISSFVVSAMVLLWVPLCDALMHAGQLETLRRGVVEHQHESNASDSIPPAPGMTGMWVAKNGDMHRTGSSHSIAPRNLASGPSWRWQAPALLHGVAHAQVGVVRSTPLIDEHQNIIETTLDGDVIKFSRDGQQLWKHSSGDSIYGIPALADGSIYHVSGNGTFFSLDSQTGEVLWQSRLGTNTGSDTHSILVTAGVVVAGLESEAGNGATVIVAASAADGHEVWRLPLNVTTVFNFLSAAHDGSILFEDVSGSVYRVSALDGSVIWHQPGIVGDALEQQFTTAGVALDMDGNIYAAFNHVNGTDTPPIQGVVRALSFGDGQVLWERRFPLQANAAVAVGNLDGASGGPLAVFVALGSNPEMPALVPNPDAFLAIDAKAVALNAASGETIWELTLPEWRGPAAGDSVLPPHICLPDQFGNPAVDGNGTAYFVRASGRIYALHDDNHDGELSEESGEVSWFDAGDAYQSAPAISNGMLAVSPCDGLMVFLSN